MSYTLNVTSPKPSLYSEALTPSTTLQDSNDSTLGINYPVSTPEHYVSQSRSVIQPTAAETSVTIGTSSITSGAHSDDNRLLLTLNVTSDVDISDPEFKRLIAEGMCFFYIVENVRSDKT